MVRWRSAGEKKKRTTYQTIPQDADFAVVRNADKAEAATRYQKIKIKNTRGHRRTRRGQDNPRGPMLLMIKSWRRIGGSRGEGRGASVVRSGRDKAQTSIAAV